MLGAAAAAPSPGFPLQNVSGSISIGRQIRSVSQSVAEREPRIDKMTCLRGLHGGPVGETSVSGVGIHERYQFYEPLIG